MNPLRRVYVRTSVSTHASMPVCVPGVALAAGDRRASLLSSPTATLTLLRQALVQVCMWHVCARARTGRQAASASMRRNFLLATLRCLLLLQLRTHLLHNTKQHTRPARRKTTHGEETIWLTGTQGTRACWCGSGPSRKLSDRRPRENCRSDSFRESSRASGACDAGSRKDEKTGSVQRAA